MAEWDDFLFYESHTRQLRFDVPAYLRAKGIPDTEENRDLVSEIVEREMHERFPEASIDRNTAAYGTKRIYNPTRKDG